MSDHVIQQEAGSITLAGGKVKVVMRNYFSSYLLAAAAQMTRSAAEIEGQHDILGESQCSLDQRGRVLSAIFCGIGFFEAMANELFQDAFDGHTPKGASGATLHPRLAP